jgi:hypothetical protein
MRSAGGTAGKAQADVPVDHPAGGQWTEDRQSLLPSAIGVERFTAGD